MSGTTTGTLLAELRGLSAAVRGREWSEGGRAEGDLGLLGAAVDPLAGLADAGVGVLTPHVSFLSTPLEQLRGDGGAVTSSARGVREVAADVGALADAFRQAAAATDGWSGEAGDAHRITGAQVADGVSALAEAAATISGAVSGAGEEVVGALSGVVGKIVDAVREMVPVMAGGIARAPLTMGLSIGEAIATCVGIAARCGEAIAEIMADLLACGVNLMKLVTAVLTVVQAVVDLLRDLAEQAGTPPETTRGTASKDLGRVEKSTTEAATTPGPGTPEDVTSTEDPSTGDDLATTEDPGSTSLAGTPDPGTPDDLGTTEQSAALPPGTTTSTGVLSPSTPDLRAGGGPATGAPQTGSGPSPSGGALPVAGAAAGTGAASTGTAGARPSGRLTTVLANNPEEPTTGPAPTGTGGAASSGFPAVPAAGGARGQGGEDTEHERRYRLEGDLGLFAADTAVVSVLGAAEQP
ncbi:hypothetical protein [Actinosynnema mirum]|uniref:Uncharacterized protein n=1 Tax=Actinosynnema mirum (strain ATCC 29888 / DSM 43827 / JCM 3225 / NBRC 14064 / NCIMB 13271 / NRRL B-12336 / IMRU 3971 / 101) TaxID=446462 RepID=C6WAQ4_ACTMD|nr:hypothetical protein [Actinosynnema mirum]ACU37373.1 hypothetical protein Amir_3479 [Actinosynnema mirum DSM 43827]